VRGLGRRWKVARRRWRNEKGNIFSSKGDEERGRGKRKGRPGGKQGEDHRCTTSSERWEQKKRVSTPRIRSGENKRRKTDCMNFPVRGGGLRGKINLLDGRGGKKRPITFRGEKEKGKKKKKDFFSGRHFPPSCGVKRGKGGKGKGNPLSRKLLGKRKKKKGKGPPDRVYQVSSQQKNSSTPIFRQWEET